MGLVLVFTTANAQQPKKIKLKKDVYGFYFFQKGKSSDTIYRNQNDLFFLKVSDSLQNSLVISLDNAQFWARQGDTVFQLRFVPGIRYECSYSASDSEKQKAVLKNFVNGTSPIEKNKIRIQFFDKIKNEMILENWFNYQGN